MTKRVFFFHRQIVTKQSKMGNNQNCLQYLLSSEPNVIDMVLVSIWYKIEIQLIWYLLNHSDLE